MANRSSQPKPIRTTIDPATRAHKRLALFPDSTRIVDQTLTIHGFRIDSLAEEFGTPLYLYDRATMDASADEYRRALQAYYPGEARITFAGKAYLSRAVAQWIRLRGLSIDCTGEGELEIARSAGLPREAMVVHGVNKSRADLLAARRYAGTIVVDNLTELRTLARLHQLDSASEGSPDIWLRLLPGIAVITHHSHTQTGQRGSKFGMTPEELAEAVQICRQENLPLNGLHFHQGSNFRDPAPLAAAVVLGLDMARRMELGPAWHLSPGGGWSIAYHEDELPQPDIDGYVQSIAETVVEKCTANGIPLPILHIEPGRSLIARAGVAIYRVGVVKRRREGTWLLVDGGMADNPRHALYGARYSCLPVNAPEREPSERVSIAGPYCETGDVLIEDLPMPHIEEGELLAIPASGAYQLSMSSNYNGARRPAVLWLEQDRATLVVERESLQELSQRDRALT